MKFLQVTLFDNKTKQFANPIVTGGVGEAKVSFTSWLRKDYFVLSNKASSETATDADKVELERFKKFIEDNSLYLCGEFDTELGLTSIENKKLFDLSELEIEVSNV